MNRIGMLLCLPALLAITFTASSVRAQGTDVKREDDLKNILHAIQDDIGRLRFDMAKQQEDSDRRQRLNDRRDEVFERRLQMLENKLDELERAAKNRTANYPPDQQIPADQLREMRARIEQLERIEKTRVAGTFVPGETVNPVPPVAAQGFVRLENLSPGTGLISVNGVMYTLLPGDIQVVPVPVGAFTFEVVRDFRGLRFPQQPRVIGAAETRTLTLRP
jgi:hypothetical protein